MDSRSSFLHTCCLLYCIRRARGVLARAIWVLAVYTAVRFTAHASYNVFPCYRMLDWNYCKFTVKRHLGRAEVRLFWPPLAHQVAWAVALSMANLRMAVIQTAANCWPLDPLKLTVNVLDMWVGRQQTVCSHKVPPRLCVCGS